MRITVMSFSHLQACFFLSSQDGGADFWQLIDSLSEKTLVLKSHLRPQLEAVWSALRRAEQQAEVQ